MCSNTHEDSRKWGQWQPSCESVVEGKSFHQFPHSCWGRRCQSPVTQLKLCECTHTHTSTHRGHACHCERAHRWSYQLDADKWSLVWFNLMCCIFFNIFMKRMLHTKGWQRSFLTITKFAVVFGKSGVCTFHEQVAWFCVFWSPVQSAHVLYNFPENLLHGPSVLYKCYNNCIFF